MNVKDKINRIVARNPELKDTILSLQDEKNYKKFQDILTKDVNKMIVVGKKSQDLIRLYELATIMNQGYIHITELTTPELLDAYVEEESSLSSIKDDLIIIHDSRAFVPNKQKTNMIMQVFEQNERCFYYYKGSYVAFSDEHPLLHSFAKDNNIKIYKLQEA